MVATAYLLLLRVDVRVRRLGLYLRTLAGLYGLVVGPRLSRRSRWGRCSDAHCRVSRVAPVGNR